jgi:flagellar assembly protein FliH
MVTPINAVKSGSIINAAEWHMPKLIEKTLDEKLKEEEVQRLLFEKEIEQIKEKAYQEGFKKGEQDGFATGKETIEKEIEVISALETELIKPLKQFTDEIFQVLKKIVEDTVMAVLLQEITIDKSILEKTIKEIFANLSDISNKVIIQCNKNDADIIKKYCSEHFESKLEIEPNENMTQGGVIVTTENSYLDATLENRVRKIINECFTQAAIKDNQDGLSSTE